MNYLRVRNKIKDCDILLYRGKSFLSKIIRLLTKSEYSHAGIAVWWNDRLMVLEAVEKGVVLTPMSKNLKYYKGTVYWFTSKKSIPQTKRLNMIRFAQQELGKKYSKWKLIVFGYKILFGKDRDKKDEFRNANSLVCSHYVAQIYNYAGIDLTEDVSDAFTLPEDIAKSDKLIYKFTIKYVQ
jgi:hypothetical protein